MRTLGTPILLKNGQATLDPRLDRIRQVDIRSLNFPGSKILLPEEQHSPRSFTWLLDTWLDQGQEGACVGFGFAHEALARPVKVNVDALYAREQVYWPAQRADEWDGGAYPGADPFYEGTAVLAGAKQCVALGLFDTYHWAMTIQEMAAAVGFHGPVVMGVDWYNGMWDVDSEGFISATGEIAGGHCICVIGVKIVKIDAKKKYTWDNVDFLRSYFLVHNSWGQGWGVNGRAKIRFVDMMKLWPSGDFCIPTGRDNPIPA